MTHRDWRSPDAYRDLEDAPLRDFAWEYLRRNPNYNDDYERTASAAEADKTARHWGLRFRSRPAQERQPSQGRLEPALRSRHGRLVGLAIAIALAIVGTVFGYWITADAR